VKEPVRHQHRTSDAQRRRWARPDRPLGARWALARDRARTADPRSTSAHRTRAPECRQAAAADRHIWSGLGPKVTPRFDPRATTQPVMRAASRRATEKARPHRERHFIQASWDELATLEMPLSRSIDYALATSSNSKTARRSSQRRRSAARRSMSASTAAGRRCASDAIAPTVRLRSPWMSLATKDATTRARRSASSGSMAAVQLKPVGVCVAMLRPLSSRVSPYDSGRLRASSRRGAEANRRELWRRHDLATRRAAALADDPDGQLPPDTRPRRRERPKAQWIAQRF
jgi:hypothetical protein